MVDFQPRRNVAVFGKEACITGVAFGVQLDVVRAGCIEVFADFFGSCFGADALGGRNGMKVKVQAPIGVGSLCHAVSLLF